MSKVRFLKVFAVLAMLAVLAGAFLVGMHSATTTHVHAAPPFTNGLAVEFSCNGDRLGDSYVYGTNQNGNYAAWHGNANGNTYFITSNWWWVGHVRIDSWDSSRNTWLHVDAYVPSSSTQGIDQVWC